MEIDDESKMEIDDESTMETTIKEPTNPSPVQTPPQVSILKRKKDLFSLVIQTRHLIAKNDLELSTKIEKKKNFTS